MGNKKDKWVLPKELRLEPNQIKGGLLYDFVNGRRVEYNNRTVKLMTAIRHETSWQDSELMRIFLGKAVSTRYYDDVLIAICAVVSESEMQELQNMENIEVFDFKHLHAKAYMALERERIARERAERKAKKEAKATAAAKNGKSMPP